MKSESGELGIEVLAFGLLIFISGTLVFLNGWGIVDAKLAAAAAAREAARAYVESPGADAGLAAADQAASDVVTGYHRDPAATSVTVTSGAFGRCQRVVVEVRTQTPLVRVPWIGQAGAVMVAARHSEIVDPFRSDLPGTSACA